MWYNGKMTSSFMSRKRDRRLASEDIMSYIRKHSFIEQNGCWLWTRAGNGSGYGVIYIKKKAKLIHRLAWEQLVGPIPEGMYVLHKCDNRDCWNPDHLYIGTAEDNKFDEVSRKGGTSE
jgi:hypothetical protein